MPEPVKDLWTRLLLSLVFLAIYGAVLFLFFDYYLYSSRLYWALFIASFLFLFFFILVFPWKTLKNRFKRKRH